MTINVYRRNLDTSYWSISGSNLVSEPLVSYQSNFFVIDPSTINSLGGTKISTLTVSQLRSNFAISTSSAVTVTAADYTDSNWAANGWTPSNDSTFGTELGMFIVRNYGQQAININFFNAVLVIARGVIGGTAYSVPFIFFGHYGDLINTNPAVSPFYDPYAQYLELAMPLNGVNGSGTLIDVLVDGRTSALKTFNNPSVVISNSISQFYATSAYFNGSNAYFEVNNNGSDFAFGSGDFTVEFWINTNNNPTNGEFLFGIRPPGSDTNFFITTEGGLNGGSGGGPIFHSSTGNYNIYTDTTLNDGKWHHLALCRTSGVVSFFMDGILLGTQADTSNYGGINNRPLIGANDYSPTVQFFNGFMQDLRVYKGIGKYTSNFVLPGPIVDDNTVLLLHFDNNTSDYSAAGNTISMIGTPSYSSSGEFGSAYQFTNTQGNFPYVDPSSANFGTNFNFSAANFTIEGWVNLGTVGGGVLWSSGQTFNANGWSFGVGGGISLFYLNGSNYTLSNNPLLPYPAVDNSWHHVAMVRNGTAMQVFVDGKVVATDMNMPTMPYQSNLPFAIGSIYCTNSFASGAGMKNTLIDEVRVSNVARYTPNTVVVPTSAFTSDAFTSLLLHLDGSLTDSSSNNFTVTTDNSPSYVTGEFNQGASITSGVSNYPYLNASSHSEFTFGTGAFSIELWVKATSGGILATSGVNGVSQDWNLTLDSNGALHFYGHSGESGALMNAPAGSFVFDGNFHYVGVFSDGVVSGGTGISAIYLVVDSAIVAKANVTENFTNNASSLSFGGLKGAGDVAYNIIGGVIDEVRISKGVNRMQWTPFEVPTIPSQNFGTAANTILLLHLDGNVQDISPFENQITVYGTPAYTAGVFGQALTTTGCFLELSAVGSEWHIGAEDFTMELWIKATGYQSLGCTIIQSGTYGSNSDWGWGMNSNLTMNFGINGNNTPHVTSSTIPFFEDGNWHHYAVVRHTGFITFYVDGVSYGGGALNNSFPYNNYPISIGGNYNNLGTTIVGSIDEVRISNIARYLAPFTPPTAPF